MNSRNFMLSFFLFSLPLGCCIKQISTISLKINLKGKRQEVEVVYFTKRKITGQESSFKVMFVSYKYIQNESLQLRLLNHCVANENE